ncbi:MAG: SDR family NAD(P)-dependent oxidoreductase [Oscillospiraceae bacterium]
MEKELFSLAGRRALVTGASRGIGKEIALTLARYGAGVAVHYVGRTEAAEEVAAAVRGFGQPACVIQKNLEDADCAEVILSQARAGLGEIDILVLNASLQLPRPWGEITAGEFARQMQVNVWASLQLMQQAAGHMQRQGWGRMVTVGSVQEAKPHPDMLVYAASKAAQTMMMRSLAAQLAPSGITVNNLAPGVILTERNDAAFANGEYREKVTRLIPAGYWGEAQDCAGAALLLCSEAGRYITGQSLLVDGGKAM